MGHLVAPHGGTLVDRFLPAEQARAVLARAPALVALALDARELADLELIANGAASPLTGFLNEQDYRRVVHELRLASGTVWPLPLTLAIPDDTRARVAVGDDVALTDPAGRLRAVLTVTGLFRRDPLEEAREVYRTTDESHPGVAYLVSRPRWLVAGPVRALPLPEDLPFKNHRLTPSALRALIEARGWKSVAGFQTRNPIHRAHEHLTKLALEFADGLVIHPLVGETKSDDVPATVRFRAYETLIERYYPRDRTVLAAFPAAMRYAGPREALFHALVRKNYGITHLIVGRDHAGVGRFYAPLEAQQIFDRFSKEEIGVSPLRFEPTFFCKACDNLASSRTCPHDAATRVELSGTKVREILKSGGHLPVQFTRPEVAEVLRAHYSSEPSAHGHVPKRGFILWFTGLSGAGKSTLAQHISAKLRSERRIEVLDGDEVRTHLSKGLGFSKEDRDTNIHRIGFVARVLARHGVGVITAAISPYAQTRSEVRMLAEKEQLTFVEVYAQAELDALVGRDTKGLYKKALAGDVKHFTGVSDPYEAPANADVVVRTDQESVEESAEKILAALSERGLVDARNKSNGATAGVAAGAA
jgi:sulfate adenylyltransferase